MKTTTPSRQVLEETAARTLKFLRAAGTTRTISLILATRGYTTAVHHDGWHRLHKVSGFDESGAIGVDENPAVRDAVAAIDAWDEPNFRIAHATLAMTFPEQDAALFAGGLTPAVGVGAILTVKTFLDRVDTLERGTKADKAAVARLAERGIDKNERKRLRALLATAESTVNVGPHVEGESLTDTKQDDLVALYAWFSEWSEVARIVIKRRDHLIALGLASRKKKAAPTPPPPVPTPVPTGSSNPGAAA
jgi:hypothetical protein